MSADITAELLNASLEHARLALAARDHAAAVQSLSQAHLLAPENGSIRLDLAAAHLACDDAALALEHARAVPASSATWRAQLIQARACQRLQRCDEAAVHLQAALADTAMAAPLRQDTVRQFASLKLNAFGDAPGAAALLREAAALPGGDVLQADLAVTVAHLYQGGLTGATLAREFQMLAARLQPPVPPEPSRARAPGTRLRIGLVSAQFCASPVGFLTLGALRAMAPQAELVFFDRGGKADWAKDAFKALAHHWLECGPLNAVQLQRLFVEAQLDAVIDLSGWTDPVTMRALAGRPVTRQIKWVGGQSFTTGASCFDGFVTDARQVPPAAAHLYTEPLLRAHHGYVTYVAPPYAPELDAAAARLPKPGAKPQPGVLALVSNPTKLGPATAQLLRQLKPKRLVLVDQRWRHEGTREAARRRLGSLMDSAKFVTPANHADYLQALREMDATFVDTAPYSMGLTAIELRLLGKTILAGPRSPAAPMCERHCVAHLAARRLDHHEELGTQLLQWCRA